MGILGAFVGWNTTVSRHLDRLLPADLRVDGNKTFREEYLVRAVRPGALVYELGGGARPFLSRSEKERLGVRVVGLDIDADELAAAPDGAYDQIIVGDLCSFQGVGEADVVICQATLEHVPDCAGAIRGIATSLRPGGRAYIFVPCRNAAFARLNLLLPQKLKERLLFSLLPEKATGHDGFKAYYDRCTPSQIAALAGLNKLTVEEIKVFWMSSYFFVFAPAYIIWRICQCVFRAILKEDAAETFILVLIKGNTE